MTEHILLWVAIAANVGGALYTIVVGRRKLRKLDELLHELENTRAVMHEFIER